MICRYIAFTLTVKPLTASDIISLLCWQQSLSSVAVLIKSAVKRLLVFQSSAAAPIALSCFRHIRRAAKCRRLGRSEGGKRLWMRSFQELTATINPEVHDGVIKSFDHRCCFVVSIWRKQQVCPHLRTSGTLGHQVQLSQVVLPSFLTAAECEVKL